MLADMKANYVVKVHDVVISPDPVKTGEATTFIIKASTSTFLYSFDRLVSFLVNYS